MKNCIIEVQWCMWLKHLAGPKTKQIKMFGTTVHWPEQEVFPEYTCACVLFLACPNVACDLPEAAAAGRAPVLSL